MTSLLNPSYTLTLGSQRFTEQAISIDLCLEAAPLLDALSVRLPSTAPLNAQLDDAVQLSLDSGERRADVFQGAISAVRRGFADVEIRSLNGGGRLAQLRPAVTYEQATVGTIVRDLCGQVGVEVATVDDGASLTYYVADPSRTALEHIARLSGWGGALARFTPQNRLESTVVNATQPEMALRYGRELLELTQENTPTHTEGFVVTGESGVGSHSEPNALRLTTDFFAGNRPAGPSASRRWRAEPALRTVQAAATAGAALQRSYASRRVRGTFQTFLLPGLRPGTVLEIQDLPSELTGEPLWVYRVRHHVSAHGSMTEVRFYRGGDSFDPAALMGTLAGALGVGF